MTGTYAEERVYRVALISLLFTCSAIETRTRYSFEIVGKEAKTNFNP